MGMGKKSAPKQKAAPAQEAAPQVTEKDYESSQEAKNLNVSARANENSEASLLGPDANKDDELLKLKQTAGTA